MLCRRRWGDAGHAHAFASKCPASTSPNRQALDTHSYTSLVLEKRLLNQTLVSDSQFDFAGKAGAENLAIHHDVLARIIRDGRATPGRLHFAAAVGTLIYLILLSDSPV
jgi:hypothetical protein